jgi:hypothetical protein
VRLVHDHRVAPVGQRDALAHHNWELLQRSDDDPRLGTGQRTGKLSGIGVALLHQAVRVLELVDGVLELPV